jgi:hypothetical protein
MIMIEKYFNGEKIQCSIGILLALISISSATYFLLQIKKPLTTGMSYPFIIIPTLLLTICIAVIIRSPKDIVRVNQMMQSDKEKIKTDELPRMQTVMKNFRVIKTVEIAIAVFSIFLFLFMPTESVWRGVGLGLLMQALMMLAFDIVAESRGKEYFEYLQKF